MTVTMTEEERDNRRNELTREIASLYGQGTMVTVFINEPPEAEGQPRIVQVMLPRGQDPMHLMMFLGRMLSGHPDAEHVGSIEMPARSIQ
jgi:hypothetical protein